MTAVFFKKLSKAAKPRKPSTSAYLPKVRKRAGGTASIKRETYSYSGGMLKNNEWYTIRREVMERDHYLCVPHRRRGVNIKAVDVHHITPLNKGGTNAKSNLMAVCEGCHKGRHAHMANPNLRMRFK